MELTILVNNQNPRVLVAGQLAIRVTPEGREKIDNGPVFDLGVAQQLLTRHGLRVVCEQADRDMGKFQPVLDEAELTNLILALRPEHYIESESCSSSFGQTVDCDAYAIHWNRRHQREWASGTKIFVKFGFRDNNCRCLVVSIHPARW